MFKKKKEIKFTAEMDRSTRLDDFIRSFKKQKTAVAAAIVLILLALIAIFCY